MIEDAHEALLRSLVILKCSYKLEVIESDIARCIFASPVLQGVDTGILHKGKMTNCGGNMSDVAKQEE
jgi:hypothetical protein